MQGILTYLNECRHTHGFGVHSPFAFRFITEVLRQQHAYYAYDRIGADHRLRMLFRVALDVYPDTAYVIAEDASPWWHAIRCAYTKCADDALMPALVVADARCCRPDTLKAYAEKGAHLYIVNADDDFFRRATDGLCRGMSFRGRNGTYIMANYSHLPRQNYNILI